jgi:hypothetical protein
MKTKDLLTVTTVAMGTAALTVATFWAGSMDADSEHEALAAKIATPKLVAQGVEMTLAPVGGETFKAGDEPAYELKAVNTTDKPANVSVRVAMASTAPADRMSRVAVQPATLWQDTRLLTLGPNETKVVTMASLEKLPANKQISVSLQAPEVREAQNSQQAGQQAVRVRPPREPRIVALNFSTKVPKAQPVSGLQGAN